MKTKIVKTRRNREQRIAFLNEEITRIEEIKLKCVARIQDLKNHIFSLEEKIKASKARQEAIEKKKADRENLRKAIQAIKEEYKQRLKQVIKELKEDKRDE